MNYAQCQKAKNIGKPIDVLVNLCYYNIIKARHKQITQQALIINS